MITEGNTLGAATENLTPAESDHARLVRRAVRWLFGTKGCAVVVAERATCWSGEIPDALGWTSDTTSILVECKASIDDFHADRQKPWRRIPEIGVGCYRWYLSNPGIIDPARHTLPQFWGLLVAKRKTISVVRPAVRHLKCHYKREMRLLMYAPREPNPLKEVAT